MGDARAVLAALNTQLEPGDTRNGSPRSRNGSRRTRFTTTSRGTFEAQYVIDELYQVTGGDAVVTTDVGQHQMWAAQFYHTDERFHWIIPAARAPWASACPRPSARSSPGRTHLVCAVVGDGGFQMTMSGACHRKQLRLPLKVVILNNRYLGMVRQWQNLFYENRLSGVDLVGNPDFVKLAESYGCRALRIRRIGEVQSVLEKALAYTEGPVVIDAEVAKEDNVFPMIPAGASIRDMILGPPRKERA